MSKLSKEIAEMRNMREAYDNLAAAAEAYNVGKIELAENITAKGVEAAATETLPELAEKVKGIRQESFTIDGGEIYAKQIFGEPAAVVYWNLYEILEQLLSDGRLVQYGGILLAEYQKNFDSIDLSGAGSGGAYVVSDKDENGQFKMYTVDATHVWSSSKFDGHGNRWVAYCFFNEYRDFEITSYEKSPNRIFIGRKVGTIRLLTNSLVSDIVVPDGNEFVGCSGNFLQSFSGNVVIRNLNMTDPNDCLLYNPGSIRSLYIQGSVVRGPVFFMTTSKSVLVSFIIEADELYGQLQLCTNRITTTCKYVRIKCNYMNCKLNQYGGSFFDWTSVDEIVITAEEGYMSFASRVTSKNHHVFINYIKNDKTKSVSFGSESVINSWEAVELAELQDGWNKPLNIAVFTGLTEINIYTYILQRLKQDKPDCGDGVTIRLGSKNLAKLTSEESVTLLDELTNTYGYTFA